MRQRKHIDSKDLTATVSLISPKQSEEELTPPPPPPHRLQHEKNSLRGNENGFVTPVPLCCYMSSLYHFEIVSNCAEQSTAVGQSVRPSACQSVSQPVTQIVSSSRWFNKFGYRCLPGTIIPEHLGSSLHHTPMQTYGTMRLVDCCCIDVSFLTEVFTALGISSRTFLFRN